MTKKWFMISVVLLFFLNQIVWADNRNDELIRLHVIANSDSINDQQLKLQIRDIVLNELCGIENLKDSEEAKEYIEEHLNAIERKARRKIINQGFNYPLKLELTKADFPTRKYGKTVLPAGKYLALKVIIGQGQGANWWCVLYPPLCHSEWIREEKKTRVEDNETIPAFANIKIKINKKYFFEKIWQNLTNLLKEVWSIS
jgi:stage II sporulation protein R